MKGVLIIFIFCLIIGVYLYFKDSDIFVKVNDFWKPVKRK